MFPAETRFLIVDDNAAMRAALINMLRQQGFTKFTEAVDGQHAVEILEAGAAFDLILSDHNMPKLSGLEFFMRIREDDRFKGIPFMMVTADSEKPTIMRSLELGAVGFLTKPVLAEQLTAKLAAAYQRAQTLKSG